MIPERPPSTKKTMKPPMNISGALNCGRPIVTVSVQANTWIVLGMTTIMLAAAKKTTAISGSPVANMWCAHTPKPMNATSSSASATSGNASIFRRANVGMIDVAIPNAGSTMMYTSGCAEDPEQVLPEQRVAAVADVEEVEAGLPLQLEEDEVDRERRQREDQRERRREDREAEERHPVQRHPRRAVLEDRDDEVDRADASSRRR